MSATLRAPAPRRNAPDLWSGLALLVMALWVAGRIHGAFAYPPMNDFDAAGHLLYAAAMRDGQLPDPQSFLAFHPPLYYAVSAALWKVLPEAVPVHSAMRLLSACALLAALWIAARSLRSLLPAPDAAVAVAATACVPAVAIAATMVGNETTCALFSTALLARTLSPGPGPGHAPPDRHSWRDRWGADLGSGVLAALAVLSKSTGLAALAFAVLGVALRERRQPRRGALCVLLLVAPTVLLAGPFFAQVAARAGGSPLAVVTSAAHAPATAYVMSRQPPGDRTWRDYVVLPAATWTAPHYRESPELASSFSGLLYASIWSDAHGQYISSGPRGLAARRVSSVLGLVTTALGLLGAACMARRRRAPELLLLSFAVALAVALARYAWSMPRFSAVKASYLLPALLPAAYALARGLGVLPEPVRPFARAALLAVAFAGLALSTWGWWNG